jgi:hypothetical protein
MVRTNINNDAGNSDRGKIVSNKGNYRTMSVASKRNVVDSSTKEKHQ